MRARATLFKAWVLSALALGLGSGCGGEGQPPLIGSNLIHNGSFEEAKLEPTWWTATDSKGGTASLSPSAADLGNQGLVLYKGTGGWGSMVGQETEPHKAGETYQVRARLKGVKGGERVTISFHGQGFEVEAETRWRTVNRLVLLPEESENASAIISVTTDLATVHVDDVSFARAQVARGDADEDEDNLLRNGSFESDLGLWNFWTDGGPEGTASTSPDARKSGYAGMVLSKGPEGGAAAVKQQLRDPLAKGEEYRLEADVKGAGGGEAVVLCVQINHAPWDGPCTTVTATSRWTHISEKMTFDPALADERVGVLISLVSEGQVLVDDVILVRTRLGR